jgi:hypothetical protein
MKYRSFVTSKVCLCILAGAAMMSDAHTEEDTVSGLVGNTEQIIVSGKTAPNGYYFEASHPHYTGFVSFKGSSEGILGIRGKNGNGYDERLFDKEFRRVERRRTRPLFRRDFRRLFSAPSLGSALSRVDRADVDDDGASLRRFLFSRLVRRRLFRASSGDANF